MSLIEIARLTEAQQAQLGAYGERWSGLRASTAACDRKAAEAGVVRAYAAAGLRAPRDIVWAGGPVEIAHACPSGAIRYRRKDGEADETVPPVNLLAVREAGKTLPTALSEVREAVDFLRYYASQARNVRLLCAGQVAQRRTDRAVCPVGGRVELRVVQRLAAIEQLEVCP